MNIKIMNHLFLVIIFETILLITYQESSQVEFVDVTNQSNINFFGKSYGSAWGDFNSDGYGDLWIGNHGFESDGPKLYLNNRNNTFIDILPELSLDVLRTKDLHGAAWADFDNDGDQDLYISVGGGRGTGIGSATYNIFLINQNGRLIDKAIDYGLEFPLSRGRMPLWFEWDGDGLLDILLVNAPRPDGQAPTSLFHQSSSGFEKILEFSDIKVVDSVHVSDLFHQGKIDLIFLNPTSEAVYELQDSSVKNIINDIGLQLRSSSDVIISDFNGDLLPDLFRATGSGANKPYQLDILEINTGMDFAEQSEQMGIVEPTSCRNAAAGDFDNDMDIDIFMVCSIWGAANEE
ncbi:MAG: FG-GAP repeat domain-containing protein, partial [Nitrosopumilaceae archaeon]